MRGFFLFFLSIFCFFLGCTPTQPAERAKKIKASFVFSSGSQYSLRKNGEAVLMSGPPLTFTQKLSLSDSVEINFSDETNSTSAKFKLSLGDFTQEKPDSFSCIKSFEGRDRTTYFALIIKNLDKKKGGLYGYYFLCILRKK